MKTDATVTIDLSNVERRLPINIKKAQDYLDNEVLIRTEPYTPLLTGRLIQSSVDKTQIGGGVVVWKTPYARKRYYTAGPIGSKTGPMRGYRWFDRMWVDNGKRIVQETKNIASGG